MDKRNRKHWILIAAILTLLFVGLGCGLPGLSGLRRLAATATPAPTSTSTPSSPTPTLDVRQAVDALQDQFIAVHEAVSPAVVNITSRGYVYDWFMRPVPQEGTGSGFVYDADGHIVTNYHVVENAEELLVTLANGQVYEAVVVGDDAVNDLAVLHIDAGADLPAPLVLADSDRLRVGQLVIAIGNPFGLEQTLTTGVISALGRVIQSPEDYRFIGEAIQTDAAINPGNSGGPLLDLEGQVIGVNSQIISPSGASSGIGFAVSSNTVRRVVPELIARGHYPHPWLGISTLTVTPTTAKILRQAEMKVPVENGLLVVEVTEGGPADQAGVQGGSRIVRFGNVRVPLDGDILTAIDGQPVHDFQDLTVYLETRTSVGDTVNLTLIRDGEEQTVSVTAGEQPGK